MFQSRTGFPGHLAVKTVLDEYESEACFNPERASQAI